jgi:hypothetical protein
MVVSSFHHRPSAGRGIMPYPLAVFKPWQWPAGHLPGGI